MLDIKNKLIKIAYENPELRSSLLPIISGLEKNSSKFVEALTRGNVLDPGGGDPEETLVEHYESAKDRLGAVDGYEVFYHGFSSYHTLVFGHDDQPVSELTFLMNEHGGYNVISWVYVTPSFRGKKLPEKMYGYLLNKGPIMSDSQLTHDSAKMWVSFSKNSSFKVSAYDLSAKKEYPIKLKGDDLVLDYNDQETSVFNTGNKNMRLILRKS